MAALTTTPTTKDAAINLFFREKAFWQFGRGYRLGDMRRLIRVYGRTQDNVFPNGAFFKNGAVRDRREPAGDRRRIDQPELPRLYRPRCIARWRER